MRYTNCAISREAALSRLSKIDLGPIKFKLVHEADETAWTLEQANIVEEQYRAYLALALMFPQRVLVPSRKIDEFWHQHILDTEKYADDCQLVFGQFLHHFPYFGIRGHEDASSLEHAFSETKSLFLEHFGIDLAQAVDCKSGECGKQCGAKCSDPEVATRMHSDIRPSLSHDGAYTLVSRAGEVMAFH